MADPLRKRILSSWDDLESGGFVEEVIKEQLKSTVQRIVEQALSSYSTFGKQLSKSIEEELRFDRLGLGLKGYNDTVLKVTRSLMNQHLEKEARDHLAAGLKEIFGGEVPEELEVSELIERFKSFSIENYDLEAGDSLTFNNRKSDITGGGWLAFDPEPNKSHYRCRYCIAYSEDGTVYSIKIDDEDPSKILFAGPFFRFERMLVQLYLNRVRLKFDVDVHLADLDIYDDDEY